MTGQQSRPVVELAGREDLAADSNLSADQAHLYGVGMSELARRAVARRGLASLAECWPQVVAQMARRSAQQAISEALPMYWTRRAEEMEKVGTAWADGAAVACRRKAWISATCGPSPDLVAEVDDVLDIFAEGVA